jgi:hypothetical protein
MAADETTVKQRVTEVLNACDAGTFGTTINTNNKHRNATAISEAVREGALMIARAICSNPNHVHRGLYVSGTPTALTHGGELPDTAGEGDLVEIQPYSGASFVVGTPRTAQEIDSYRSNVSSLYSSNAHNVQNSPIGTYYAISQGRIRFSGYAAQMYHPLISRSTVASLIPDEYEDIWTALSIGLSVKEGDNLLPVAGYYMSFGQQQLALATGMGTVAKLPPPQMAMEARRDA